MIPRVNRYLPHVIALNLVVALVLLVMGDAKNAALGIGGAGCFMLALMLTERRA